MYALSETQVLRRYRTGTSAAREAETMRRVAELGYPVPRVYRAVGPDLVMERLYGPTLAEAVGAGDMTIAAGAALLADLHRRLHELPGPVAGEPEMRQLHLDLHPENVMLTPAGPVVIDWCNAALGPPDLDVALTAIILGQLAADETMPLAEAVGVFLAEFLHWVGGDPERELQRAVELRRADAMMSATEIRRLNAATMIVRRCLESGPTGPGAGGTPAPTRRTPATGEAGSGSPRSDPAHD